MFALETLTASKVEADEDDDEDELDDELELDDDSRGQACRSTLPDQLKLV